MDKTLRLLEARLEACEEKLRQFDLLFSSVN
jgi:hypothetical protein